jgi:hypothetical protein
VGTCTRNNPPSETFLIQHKFKNLRGGSRDGEILAFSEIENLMALGHPVL